MEWDFTYKGLDDYFKFLKTIGSITSFVEVDDKSAVVLRHDVDLDISSAFYLAAIEYTLGIKSTFFVRTRAETYNIFSVRSIQILKKMVSWGFEIGLHFDPFIYIEDRLQSAVESEINLLRSSLGRKVYSISIHNPSLSRARRLQSNKQLHRSGALPP